MTVVYTDEFAKQFAKLPVSIQRHYRKQEAFLRENPFDSRLHAKPLKDYDGVFSLRVTRRYRVLFRIDGGTVIICLTVAHRKEVYE